MDISLEEAKTWELERKEAKKKDKELRKAKALKLLIDGKTKEEIAAETSLQWMEVNRIEAEYIAKQQQGILVASYLENRKKLLPKVLECGLNLLANGLKHRLEQSEPLDLKEAEIVSRIISNVDHIARLDAGDPTSIIDVNKTIPTTLHDMVRALKQDPFIDTQKLAKEITFEDTARDDSGREATDTGCVSREGESRNTDD